ARLAALAAHGALPRGAREASLVSGDSDVSASLRLSMRDEMPSIAALGAGEIRARPARDHLLHERPRGREAPREGAGVRDPIHAEHPGRVLVDVDREDVP